MPQAVSNRNERFDPPARSKEALTDGVIGGRDRDGHSRLFAEEGCAPAYLHSLSRGHVDGVIVDQGVASSSGLCLEPYHVALGDIGFLESDDVMAERQERVQFVRKPSDVSRNKRERLLAHFLRRGRAAA